MKVAIKVPFLLNFRSAGAIKLPLECNYGYEKETVNNRHPVHADAETPANAGINIAFRIRV